MEFWAAATKKKKEDPPDEATVLVDPAGLHHIRGGPFGAAGAAGANYQWLEISEAEAFPEDVQEAITTECQAKYHAYADGRKKCIHVVGPDFRDCFDDMDCTIDDAVKKLTLAYGNVFEEFCGDKSLRKMRLLPISGGIFSGPFKDDLPEITAKAVQAAYDALTAEKKEHIMQSSIEMCIFMEPEFKLFASAFEQPLAAPSPKPAEPAEPAEPKPGSEAVAKED
mmetsp:Transcript_83715/g.132676  ORF Transcript_83715/g.132676 Transcript_83715/m.132676 type:complete len:224 (-) Transcript_83715:52-723(-)